MSESSLRDRFVGLERLYGQGCLERFSGAHVAIIGLGGVGSWAAEALARSAVGKLTLIDADDICVSNTNRQIHALDGQFGRAKVHALAERLTAIHPTIQIEAIQRFLTVNALDELLDRGYDVVLDACDAFRVKVETIVWCRRRRLPLIVSGSAGGRIDATKITVRDLSRTEHDAMLALIRRKLREEFGFSSNHRRSHRVPCVFSMEQPRWPQADGSISMQRPKMAAGGGRLDCAAGLGAATHVTASFGMVAAGKVLETLLEKGGQAD